MNTASLFRRLGLLVVLGTLGVWSAAGSAQDATRAATTQGATVSRVQATSTKPARVKKVKVAPGDPRFHCEDGECECKGVLDCKDLLDSGSCKGKEFWQDGKDPSVGGCG